jgi:hypothetical protein
MPAVKLSGSAEPIAAWLQRSVLTRSRMTDSRLIGALFLSGFLVYGVGFGLVKSVTGAPDFLSTVSAHRSILVFGAFLMLLNTVVDVGKGVLFFPILENHGKRTALGYLATMIVEVVLLDVGVLALLMIAPLSDQHGVGAGVTKALGSLAIQANAMAYQVAEMSLAVGCVFLCVLLFRTRLIPRWLAISGLIGYPILMAGAIAEIFGIHIGVMLTIPGMFFELVLPFWLFSKGFQPEAYRGQPAVESPA